MGPTQSPWRAALAIRRRVATHRLPRPIRRPAARATGSGPSSRLALAHHLGAPMVPARDSRTPCRSQARRATPAPPACRSRRPLFRALEPQFALEIVQARGVLPAELLLVATEVPVRGGPPVDGPAQVEVPDDGGRAQVEDGADGGENLGRVDGFGAERFDHE